MFGVKLRNKHNLAHPGDAHLKAILQQWHGIEPRSNFESCVWRRIRMAAGAESSAPGLGATLRAWLTAEPLGVNAMAAIAGLVVGVLAAFSVPQLRTDPSFVSPLLHSQTLAGAYLTMVSGGIR